MRIRFFGSSDCKECLRVFVILEKSFVKYEYVDAHDENDEIQDFCDKQNVDELPHLQFVDDDDTVIIDHKGPIEDEEFMTYLVNYFTEE